MYRYSHRQTDMFMGEFSTPAEALNEGRTQYGSDVTIYVAYARPLYYSDVSAEVLKMFFADLKEVAASKGCNDADITLHELGEERKRDLVRKMVDTVEEWEQELPHEAQLGGWKNVRVFKYSESMEVGEEWLRENN